MPPIRSTPGQIWRVTLARPEARNAVTEDMLSSLRSALADAAVDPGARVVVLDSEGPDFCAGADLDELERAVTGPEAASYGRTLDEVLGAIVEHTLPVIAKVRGAALGAGCQLVLAADLAIAATDARIGVPSARLGLVMGFASIRRLVAAVGSKRAAEMLLGGRALSGGEASAAGLVNAAVAEDALGVAVEELAAAVARGAPLSVRASKRGIGLAAAGLDRGEFEMLSAAAFGSDDLKEGLRAFRQRRSPEFQGR
ncbi:MAG TPA: enoyl-CoA hydratase/isomerase family protein [Actinomycetota bacterium]|nr:enoyl-CoA hydratase/isomerase family protein [Actinomycetota bacterium]